LGSGSVLEKFFSGIFGSFGDDSDVIIRNGNELHPILLVAYGSQMSTIALKFRHLMIPILDVPELWSYITWISALSLRRAISEDN